MKVYEGRAMSAKWKVVGLLCVCWMLWYALDQNAFYRSDGGTLFLVSSFPLVVWLICWWSFGESRNEE